MSALVYPFSQTMFHALSETVHTAIKSSEEIPSLEAFKAIMQDALTKINKKVNSAINKEQSEEDPEYVQYKNSYVIVEKLDGTKIEGYLHLGVDPRKIFTFALTKGGYDWEFCSKHDVKSITKYAVINAINDHLEAKTPMTFIYKEERYTVIPEHLWILDGYMVATHDGKERQFNIDSIILINESGLVAYKEKYVIVQKLDGSKIEGYLHLGVDPRKIFTFALTKGGYDWEFCSENDVKSISKHKVINAIDDNLKAKTPMTFIYKEESYSVIPEHLWILDGYMVATHDGKEKQFNINDITLVE